MSQIKNVLQRDRFKSDIPLDTVELQRRLDVFSKEVYAILQELILRKVDILQEGD